MEFRLFILAGIVAIGSPITISTNGNSPERKMVKGGMMIDAQKGLNPMKDVVNKIENKTNYEKSRKVNHNVTKLSLNERYRRLIPYMTFYYANDDLASPSTEPYSTGNVEVQKVHIEENVPQRTAKKINTPPNRYIPRYQGNRLTKYNIASANPTGPNPIKSAYPTYTHSIPAKSTPNHSPLYLEQSFMSGHTFGRNPVKYSPTVGNGPGPHQQQQDQTRKPYQNLFHADDSASIHYYVPQKEPTQRYKLVPYEQSSPVQVGQALTQNYHHYDRLKSSIPVPVVSTNNNQFYAKTRPRNPPIKYENVIVQPPSNHLQNYPVTETYYERSSEPSVSYERQPQFPAVESGFIPMVPSTVPTEEPVAFVRATTAAPPSRAMPVASIQVAQTVAPIQEYTSSFVKPEYYDYVPPAAQYESPKYSTRDSATLSEILSTLQKSNSIPQPITKENVGSSIRTLLQVLSALKASAQGAPYNDIEAPVLSTPRPFVASPKNIIEVSAKPELLGPSSAEASTAGFEGEDYLAPVNMPSQHLDHDYRGSSQAFPLVIASEDDGGTPGRAGVDYPTLTVIPPTSFDCKTQRYKGFFADPETKCQVWHYCDLNGGQASFLCPNGTIFSQAALTCDWWFNVRCASTHQLYVLNERLYKYILPHSPKFPEDYSGPLVDKYLTIKFKEMEEQFRKNKKKQSGAADVESDANDEADSRTDADADSRTDADADNETLLDADSRTHLDADDRTETEADSSEGTETGNIAVSEASVVVESPGNSGMVQHLED